MRGSIALLGRLAEPSNRLALVFLNAPPVGVSHPDIVLRNSNAPFSRLSLKTVFIVYSRIGVLRMQGARLG